MSQLQVSHRARTLLDWNRSEAATKETLCCSVHMIITLSSLQGDGNYFSTAVLIPQLVLNSQQQSQKCLYLGVNISDSQRNLLICCFASSQWKCRSASREQCWVEVAITRIRVVMQDWHVHTCAVVHFLQTNPNLRLKLPHESHLARFQAERQTLAQDLTLEVRSVH